MATPTSPASSTHESAPVPDLPPASRSGLWLFFAYLAVYAAFVAVSAFAGTWLARVPFGGVNLAVWWGFMLIVLPLILALVYLRTARKGG